MIAQHEGRPVISHDKRVYFGHSKLCEAAASDQGATITRAVEVFRGKALGKVDLHTHLEEVTAQLKSLEQTAIRVPLPDWCWIPPDHPQLPLVPGPKGVEVSGTYLLGARVPRIQPAIGGMNADDTRIARQRIYEWHALNQSRVFLADIGPLQVAKGVCADTGEEILFMPDIEPKLDAHPWFSFNHG